MLGILGMRKQNLLNVITKIFVCLSFLAIMSACADNADTSSKHISYTIVNTFPHDPSAFTQGLAWDDGSVYEGTGRYGASSLRLVDYRTWRTKKHVDYPDHIFAEGVTVFHDRIYQLTWKNNTIFIYNKSDLSLLETQQYPRDGWGITHDEDHLIASDGTEVLYFLDPETLKEERQITVQDDLDPITELNELEYIKGKIFANILGSDRIAVIDPNNGHILNWIDFSGLRSQLPKESAAKDLNGIMFDRANDRLFVTGKYWPKIFEVIITQ